MLLILNDTLEEWTIGNLIVQEWRGAVLVLRLLWLKLLLVLVVLRELRRHSILRVISRGSKSFIAEIAKAKDTISTNLVLQRLKKILGQQILLLIDDISRILRISIFLGDLTSSLVL